MSISVFCFEYKYHDYSSHSVVGEVGQDLDNSSWQSYYITENDSNSDQNSSEMLIWENILRDVEKFS